MEHLPQLHYKMLTLDDFVFGATVRLSFDISKLPDDTTIEGKLLRNGTTHALTNSTVDNILTMSSPTNELPVGKYNFVLTWYTISTDEPIEQIEAVLIIKEKR